MQEQHIIFKPHNGSASSTKQIQQKQFVDNDDGLENDVQQQHEQIQPLKKQEFTFVNSKIAQTDLSLSTSTLNNQKILKINKSGQTKQVRILFPKQSKIKMRASDIAHSVRAGSIQSSRCEQLSVTSENIRGLTYDEIKPKIKSKNMFEKLIDFSDEVYKKVFDSDQQHLMPCQCKVTESVTLRSEFLSFTCPLGKQLMKLIGEDKNIPALFNQYQKLQDLKAEKQHLKQINLDIKRTLPFLEKFQEEDPKFMCLQNVLRTYSVYDSKIGYTQGMNFIASSLVYHCDEFAAFWILVSLIKLLELTDIYLPSMNVVIFDQPSDIPGLSKHLQIIDFLVLHKLPDLYTHFCQNNVTMEMFCSPWLFSLFGMMVPIEKMGLLIQNILKDGWSYIYRFIIAYLVYNQEILLTEDMTGILSILSAQNYKINQDIELEIEWDDLLESAWNVEINKKFISEMHGKYDQQHQIFKI